jgi:hypothetical protein
LLDCLIVKLVEGLLTFSLGNDQLIIRQMSDWSFPWNKHLIALELKLVEVKNFEMSAEHAFDFIDGPLDGDVDFELFFGVNYFEVSGFL